MFINSVAVDYALMPTQKRACEKFVSRDVRVERQHFRRECMRSSHEKLHQLQYLLTEPIQTTLKDKGVKCLTVSVVAET